MVMKKVLFLVLIIVTASSMAFPQSSAEETKQIELNICQPSLTDAGRQSSFRFNYTYLVITDKNGSIKDVKELSDHKKFKYLTNDEKVVPCIREWKLKPSEKYLVVIGIGTTGGENLLSIVSKTVKIKFIL